MKSFTSAYIRKGSSGRGNSSLVYREVDAPKAIFVLFKELTVGFCGFGPNISVFL